MGYYLFFLLVVSIGFIVWLTAYRKVNAFFALLAAALLVGLFSGMPLSEVTATLKTGFGHTMEKIGLLILLGTALGVVLEKTGATASMAAYILSKVSERHAPAAIGLTGFIIGLPIFCDSGFIVLSGLNHSLARRAHTGMPVMAAVLATSLYAVHCLVPPHPGITAAVGIVGGNTGSVMLLGIVLAVPAALVGYLWSIHQGSKRGRDEGIGGLGDWDATVDAGGDVPPVLLSFLPVLLPIILIAGKSVALLLVSPGEAHAGLLFSLLMFAGEPVIALLIALLVSFILIRGRAQALNVWLGEGIEKAGVVLAIIAGGGMFGEMLQATGMGRNLGEMLGGLSLGIFFPFIITAILKTAQGSSTVAIMTAASLVAPLLPQLHLESPMRTTLALLSMGAGSMVVSHANDAYFWVISKFSGLETKTTVQISCVASALMGVVVQLILWTLSLFIA
jgi:GntP family gluconate:H+ symporter